MQAQFFGVPASDWGDRAEEAVAEHVAEFSADAGAHFQVVCCVKGFEIYRWFIGPREMNPVDAEDQKMD